VRTPLRAAGAAVRRGLCITETVSGIVYFAAAAQLRRYSGLRTNLRASAYNLEGAKYVAG
jgi:hypothetical protein